MAIEMKLIGLILLSINIDAIVATKLHLFTRVMRVAQHDHSMYILSSNTGIPNRGMCAMYCEKEDCFSFSYTEVDKRCETYSRLLGEENDADVAMSTMYFSKSKELRNCSDIPHGSASGVYQITLTDVNSLDLFCDMDTAEGPWTVIQNRKHGDVDFYRNWTNYKSGFGDLHGDFWIGNDILHLLTNTSSILRVELEAWDGTKGFAQYSKFQVANEDQDYRLLVQGFSGNVSYDAMTYHDGLSFTTYDRDNDLHHDNCAQRRRAGWWYKHCCRSNLNGRHQPDSGDDAKSMFWWSFLSNRYRAPLKTSMMMIR